MQRGLTAAVLLVACGGAPASTTGTASDDSSGAHAAHAEQGTIVEAPAEGSCGGLAALGRDHTHSFLADRIRVLAPEHAERATPPHDDATATPSEEHAEVAWLQSGDSRMAIFVEELLRRADGPLATWFEGTLPPEWTPVTVASLGARAVAAVPVTPRDSGGDVHLLEAYVEDNDGMVLRVLFVTSPDVARTGGCLALARSLAEGISVGERHAADEHGDRPLFDDIAILIPSGHHLVVEHGPGFELYRVIPVLSLDAPPSELGIYVGASPTLTNRPGAVARTTTTLGQEVTWHDSDEGGFVSSEGLLELAEGRRLHIHYSADAERVAGLRAVAESIHQVTAPPSE